MPPISGTCHTPYGWSLKFLLFGAYLLIIQCYNFSSIHTYAYFIIML
nr:MAG TPA: hypothetical protein [Caudoviricetes sp.]